MFQRNAVVLGITLCALLAMGFAAGQAASKAPVPPFTLTPLPLVPESPGYPNPTFLLADSQSPTVRLVTLRYAQFVDPNWAVPRLVDDRVAFIVLAEFDLAKLPASAPEPEAPAPAPPAKP